jgi:hypothetical protein
MYNALCYYSALLSISQQQQLAEMRRLADIGDVTGVLRVLSRAVKCGVKLDIIVYTVALSACAK